MNNFKRLLNEGSGYFPEDVTATKIINFIIKNYQGKKIKRMGTSSNPYSAVQEMGVRVDKKKGNEIIKKLKEEGWTKAIDFYIQPRFQGRVWESPNKMNRITVFKDGEIKVTGPKKAKKMTVPYYD